VEDANFLGPVTRMKNQKFLGEERQVSGMENMSLTQCKNLRV
jgi:hypothetical protein